MQKVSFVEGGIIVFKIIATTGYIVFGVFAMGLAFFAYKKILKEEYLVKKYKWMFILFCIVYSLLLILVYLLFFKEGFLDKVIFN
ncbi:MAG: hypothetical protein US53_C0027G0005 [Candidatus Woesebacteria bacterium GW2011_GWA1_37_7]|uniref:Uncharacterized protein n=1 Tax=Candidatus Woesebacteria bacterium GW2011_GWA1_37_7 TaxID=1618545 RepID=A0A0G0HF28_9BACT|nr:MAG: hypothetical protein US53_C0027G0005 [Candidatus Woesebacteria bacterium GW2011_GWA1_37_7]